MTAVQKPELASKPALDPSSIESFLDNLPLSLLHHSSLFASVGITTAEHLRPLSQLPKRSVNEFITVMRERGLSFMESLVLRTALNALRQPPLDGWTEPRTIEAFLQQISPPMGRHAQVFRDLGIDIAHVAILAELDAESYHEFEGALEAGGLTWIERFVIRAKICSIVQPELPEPLLTAF